MTPQGLPGTERPKKGFLVIQCHHPRHVARRAVLFLVCGALLVGVAPARAAYGVGMSQRTITPCTVQMQSLGRCSPDFLFASAPRPAIYASGYNPDPGPIADHDEVPLTVRALAISDSSGGLVVFTSLDVLQFDREFVNGVRAAVAGAPHYLPGECILLNASHTHRAPTMSHLVLDREGPVDVQYVAAVAQVTAATINAAVQNAKDFLAAGRTARLFVSTGSSAIAHYRRGDGIRPRAPVPGGADLAPLGDADRYPQRLDVLRIIEGSELLTVAAFFPCHPTTTAGDVPEVFSADFPGVMRRTVEADLGVPEAYLFQGFAGDLQSLDWAAGGANSRTTTGTTLALDVENALAGSSRELSGPIAAQSTLLSLPLWDGVLPTEFQSVQFGVDLTASSSWVVAAVSHEVVSEYASAYRMLWPRQELVTLIGYSNSTMSYLPTERMGKYDNWNLASGSRYEGCGSFLGSYGGVAPSWTDEQFLFAGFPWRVSALPQNNGTLFDPTLSVARSPSNLQICPLSQASGWHYSGLVSPTGYDLRGRAVTVEVRQPPNAGTNAELLFSIGVDGDNHYRFTIQNGYVRTDFRLGGVPTYSGSTPFSPSTHRYLRLRHEPASDTIVWEASANRRAWSTMMVAPRSFSIEKANIQVIAGTWKAEANPGCVVVGPISVTRAMEWAN